MEEKNIQLPTGWRPLDLEIFEKLTFLEVKCTILSKRGDDFIEMIKSLRAIIDIQDRAIERLQLDRMKFDEAYYHIFPDRLEQDVRLFDQLEALNSKPVPDVDSKKE
jgi:hypothetical protein